VNIQKQVFDWINLYPNPASSILYVEFSLRKEDLVSIKLFDITGRETGSSQALERSAGDQRIAVDISHLRPGVYFVLLETDRHSVSARIVVTR
jgi:hypothetical protein